MKGSRASSGLLLLLSLAGIGALPRAAGAQPPADSIPRWVEQLDDDRFAVREAATRNLVEAGKRAIEPVTKAAVSNDPEVTHRAVRVLRELTRASDSGTAHQAKMALIKLR